MPDFYQPAPRLGNQYLTDAPLRALLARLVPTEVRAEIEPGLQQLGERAVTDLARFADDAEAHPPRHLPYDAWGRRVDRIEVSAGWRALDRVAAEEGIVASAYERRFGAHSRVDHLARLYLYHPSSAVYSCPLAMTDGAARCLELYAGDDARLRAAFAHLTTRDPEQFWTSGQWMTERTGGSDVSATSTLAHRDSEGAWRLTGSKWFTSATTSQMAITLARPEGAPAGSAGLSLFYLELRDAAGALQNIEVHRLKDKLGTKALPTAELSLRGTPALLLGGEGNGVRKVAALLNVTRVYNACCAAAGMRRAVALATAYARERVAFGRPIIEHPLHAETLAAMQVETEAALQLVFHVGALLGRDECGVATDAERALLRLLTPVVKLYTAKQAVGVASEALEAFGGAGYIEDTGFPRLLRDAQVLSIWEGTTNVLSLDMLRALEKSDALRAWLADIESRVTRATAPQLAGGVTRVRDAAVRIAKYVEECVRGPRESVEAGARFLAYAIARVTAGALLLEQAQWSVDDVDKRPAVVARRWCAMELAPVRLIGDDWRHESASLLDFNHGSSRRD